MSNKSSRGPGQASQAVDKFVEMLNKAAEKVREKQQSELGHPDELPKPASQTIKDDCFEWLWKAGKADVHARYDRITGAWLCGLATSDHMMELSADEAKGIGEALLASFAWQNIWKQHVADYMLGTVACNCGDEHMAISWECPQHGRVENPNPQMFYKKEEFDGPVVELGEDGEPI